MRSRSPAPLIRWPIWSGGGVQPLRLSAAEIAAATATNEILVHGVICHRYDSLPSQLWMLPSFRWLWVHMLFGRMTCPVNVADAGAVFASQVVEPQLLVAEHKGRRQAWSVLAERGRGGRSPVACSWTNSQHLSRIGLSHAKWLNHYHCSSIRLLFVN